jgi:hypothetical protein
MALRRQWDPVPQEHYSLACGAASCLYLLKLLGVAQRGDDVPGTFKHTMTIGCVEALGSSPDKIASYLEERCAGRQPQITIQRLKTADYAGKPWIWALKFLLDYPKAPPDYVFTDNDAILRFVTIKGSMASHFVVETRFKLPINSCQIADPAKSRMDYPTDYDSWLHVDRSGYGYEPTGLDLIITG